LVLPEKPFQRTPLRTALWDYIHKIDYVKVTVILREIAAAVK
jgi:hypothetical protein